MILFFALIIVSYLLGCCNTSILYSMVNFRQDIRTKGSGNAGATNMLRSFGKTSAVITFAGDMLKVVIAIGIAWICFKDSVYLNTIKAIMGLACVLGHCFPVFFKFKGGKGIASGAMCILMLDWRVFVVAIALFALIVATTKYVSLGSIVGALTYPIGLIIVRFDVWTIVFALLTTILVVGRHYKNIIALCRGTERKIGQKA